jgi:hypothetical protein
MTDTELDLQVMALGVEAEAFCKSSLGRALTQRAKDEIESGVEDLKEADPEDPKAIREIQNRIWRASAFIVWLAEIVQEGTNKEAELTTPGEGD